MNKYQISYSISHSKQHPPIAEYLKRSLFKRPSGLPDIALVRNADSAFSVTLFDVENNAVSVMWVYVCVYPQFIEEVQTMTGCRISMLIGAVRESLHRSRKGPGDRQFNRIRCASRGSAPEVDRAPARRVLRIQLTRPPPFDLYCWQIQVFQPPQIQCCTKRSAYGKCLDYRIKHRNRARDDPHTRAGRAPDLCHHAQPGPVA